LCIVVFCTLLLLCLMLMHVDAAAAYVATQVLFQLTCVTPSAMVAMAHCCRQLMLQLRVVAVE